jgi:hypothetical protein
MTRTAHRAEQSLAVSLALCLSLAACKHVSAVRLADFKSDGCSMFPDGSYYSCCYLHDVAYWTGGTAEERENADTSLRDCVLEITHNEALADSMYRGVQMGGGPGLPTSYRWGYGWPFPHRKEYSPLTAEERSQVAEKTRSLCATIHLNPSTGGFVASMADVNREISAGQARQMCPGL